MITADIIRMRGLELEGSMIPITISDGLGEKFVLTERLVLCEKLPTLDAAPLRVPLFDCESGKIKVAIRWMDGVLTWLDLTISYY